MYKVGSPKIKREEETQIPGSSRIPSPIPKAVLIAGSSVVIVIFVLLAFVFFPKNDVPLPITAAPQILLGHTPVTEPLSEPGLAAPQPSQQIEPVVAEPGSAGTVTNNSFYSLISLVKAHQRASIFILAGVLTFLALAITLGVIFGRPSETVVDQPEVKEIMKNETELNQSGEESFWQQNMWPIISVIGVIVIIVLFLLAKNKNFSCPSFSLPFETAATKDAAHRKLFETLRNQIDAFRKLRKLIPELKTDYTGGKDITTFYPSSPDCPLVVTLPMRVANKDISCNMVLRNLFKLGDAAPDYYGLVLASTSPKPESFVFDISGSGPFYYWIVYVDDDDYRLEGYSGVWDALAELSELFKVQIKSCSDSWSLINEGVFPE
jgi:hypothetical protein